MPGWASQVLDQANRAFENQSYQTAYQQYAQVYRLLPYRSDVKMRLAESALQIGLVDEGRAWLQELAQSDKLSAEGWLSLAALYEKDGNIAQAIVAYQRIPAESSESEAAHSKLLKLFISQQKWSDAQVLAQTYSQNPLLIAGLGLFTSPGEAIQTIRQFALDELLPLQLLTEELITESDPVAMSAIWIRIGEYFDDREELDLARAAYQHAVDLAPQSGAAWAWLAGFLAHHGLDGGQEIQQALTLDPDGFLVNQTAGYVNLQSNKPEIALIYLQKARRILPDDAQTLLLLSRAELTLGQYPQGLADWLAAAELTDEPDEILRDIVEFTLQNPLFLRDYGLPALRKIMQQESPLPDDYDLAAKVYLSLEDPLTAERYWRTAMGKYPTSYINHLHLGIWLVESGSVDEGMALVRKAAVQTTDESTRLAAQQWLAGRGN